MLLKPKKFYKALFVSSKVGPKRGLLFAGFTPLNPTKSALCLRRSNLTGFTLIELLVVIGIITILASVLLITFKGVDEKAKLTNLIQFSQSQRTAFFNDLVGWWPFDELVAEGASTTTIDNSFQRNNGVVHGGVKVAKGIINSALEFNGVDGYVEVPNSASLNITDAITIEAWVKTSDERGYFAQKLAGGWGWGTGYGLTTWGLILGIDTGGGAEHISVPYKKNIFDNNWHYVAGTAKNNNSIKIYVDGALDNEGSFPNIITTNSATLTLSGRPGWDQLVGLIDEVQIYNVALPLAVIQQHYAQGLERHQNLARR